MIGAPDAPGKTPIFVASTGGHLVELTLLAPLLEPERHDRGVWITHQTPQSHSMMAGRRVHYVPYVRPRDLRGVISRTPTVLEIMQRANADVAYSTGASLALAALPLARTIGARPVFIESLARTEGSSLAGRCLELLPWVTCLTQYPGNAGRRWGHMHSLHDLFRRDEPTTPKVGRVLVTLGTIQPYGFDRLVRRLLTILPPDMDVVWQTGATRLSDKTLPGRVVSEMSEQEFVAEITKADVVVAHAGVGTYMRCLESGKAPILIPRRREYGEHVDDHQVQIANAAAGRGLALMRDADQLTFGDLELASTMRVRLTLDGV